MVNKLISIAKEAGEILKEGYSSKKVIHHKSAIDLMTDYDMKIEIFLKEKLREQFPEYTIVGEETSSTIPTIGKNIYVDPIDGTTNFVHSIPHVAISIGIWEDNTPLSGIVYNPVLDEMYYAQKDKGAFLNNEPIKVSQTNELQQSLIATGFPYTKIEKGDDYNWVIESMKNILPNIRDIRRLGSAALDLCYLAQGKTDAFYEVNLKPWDVAAGIIILEEAGGKVSTLNNEIYTLEKRVIIASNSQIHTQLAKHL